MPSKNKGKSLVKDIALLLSIWGPLLFIIIGGLIWRDDGFDGTIMEQLFPAMFFGFMAAFAVVIILSNIFKYSSLVWIIGAVIIFVATVVFYMLGQTSVLITGAIVLSIAICLLVLVRWIAGS